MHNQSVATLSQVNKTYQRGNELVHALENVSFDLYHAEMAALVGPSGCGKSTCINLLAGVDEPNDGKIVVCGQVISKCDEKTRLHHLRNHVGIVFQAFHLMPYLTVEENIALPLSISNQHNPERVRQLIERVGLDHRRNHFPAELSGGEQQRTAIARALVHQPAIVLADEPTGNLDQQTGLRVLELLRELRQEEGVTLLIATHDLNLASHAGRIIYIKDGRLESIDTP